MINFINISESLLQFIWQFQYFNKSGLFTIEGETLQIIFPGNLNVNQGPDFLEAKLKIGKTLWIGNVELHIKSSDWDLHNHGKDGNYSNIILHVVWLNNEKIKDANGKFLPALEMQHLVSKFMLQKYEQLMQSQGFVPCEKYLPCLSEISWLSWKERLIAERLEYRSSVILEYLKESGFHWEEVFWWLLARNFGIKVNSEIFEKIARTISINILAKHKNQIHQLEALLLGQAGLLQKNFNEDYPKLLQREYKFLQKKYNLVSSLMQPAFLRMRPANFPTIRLAQLAMLVNQSAHLFSKIKDAKSTVEVKKFLSITANDYWHYHYTFDEAAAYKPKKLGLQMIDNIIINTIIPVLFAYGIYANEQVWKDKAVVWLSELLSEQNSIITSWKTFGISSKTALDSQALIELKKNYCNEKLCLNCAVGNKLLKESPIEI